MLPLENQSRFSNREVGVRTIFYLGMGCSWLLFNIGCDIPRLHLRIEQTGDLVPTFDFSEEYYPMAPFQAIPYRRANREPLYQLQVWQVGKGRTQGKCFWEIEAMPGAERYLNEVKYGKVPKGWKELISARPLQKDCTYCLNQDRAFVIGKNGTYTVLPDHFFYFKSMSTSQSAE